jgi:4-oxalocrotonate tautomerase
MVLVAGSSRRSAHGRRAQEAAMPFVNVKLVKGVFDASQKQEMITKLTETMVGIEGEAMRQVTWCTIDEVESGDWASAATR